MSNDPLKQAKIINEDIGKRIRELRIKSGMSQAFVAQKLGITFQQVQKYENGTNRVSAARLSMLAEILDTHIMRFYADKPEEVDLKASIEEMVLSCQKGLVQIANAVQEAVKLIRETQ